MPVTRHRALPIGLCAWLAVSSLAAQPDDAKTVCIRAHIDAQRSRKAGRLIEGRALLERCSSASCPGALREECQAMSTEFDAALPTLLVDARDSRGVSLRDARVLLDERLVARELDGRELPADPGAHQVTIESAAGRVELPIFLREGDKRRRLSLVFPSATMVASAPAAIPTTSGTPSPSAPGASASQPSDAAARPAPRLSPAHVGLAPGAAPIVVGLGATSALALGTFATFALLGRAEQRAMEAECAPFCAPDRPTAMHRDYLIADVALAAAVVTGAAGLWVYLGRQQIVFDARGLTLRGRF
jgi:hypothetical protein